MFKATKIAEINASFWLALVVAGLWVGCTPPGPAALLEGESHLDKGEWDAAIESLKQATNLMPERPEAWNFLGLAYHRKGAAQSAADAYQTALRLNRDHLAARYNLGNLLLENREFENAETHLKTYEILAESDFSVWVKIGQAQLGYGEYAAAKTSFETALRANRKQPEAWNGLGLIHLRKGNPRDAYDYFNTAIEEERDYAPAYLNQAIILQQNLNDLPRALQKYRRFMFLDPKTAEQNDLKSLTAALEEAIRPKPEPETAEEPAEVVEDVEAAETPTEVAAASPPETEKTDPEPETPKPETVVTVEREEPVEPAVASTESPTSSEGEGGVGEATGEVAQGAGALETTLAGVDPSAEAGTAQTTEPPYREVTMAVDKTYVPVETITEDVPQAEYSFALPGDEPKNQSPSSSESTGTDPDGEWRTVATRRSGMGISVGRQLFQGGDNRNASSQRTRRTAGLRQVPNIPYTYRQPSPPASGNRSQADPFFLRGNTAMRANRASEAILAYREAISRDPAFFEAYYNMGLAAIRSGFSEQALEAYELALVLRPDHRNARYNFALALEQGQHIDAAVAELERVLDRYPSDVNAHYTLATLFAKKKGDAESARPHYERVLELDGNFQHAVSIRYWLSAAD